jgi:NTE family protein
LEANRGAVAMDQTPPDVILLVAEWRERALLRAQLIEEGYDVIATDTWPIPRRYRQPDMKPRVLIVDLRGLPDARATLEEVRFVIPPDRVLVLMALGALTENEVRRLGFKALERPTTVGQVVAAAATLLSKSRFACGTVGKQTETPIRIGLVLSGGGLRGAGHLGVLRQLVANRISIDVIVGSSAGAIVAAYYAAVGLTLDELIADAHSFRGRHLMAHSLNVRLGHRFDRTLGRLSGLIPRRLEQLKSATFDHLHHGIQGIGIVCHDTRTDRPCYFATGAHRGVPLSEVVRASASIPYLFPSIEVEDEDEERALLLADGGLSDCLPVAFALRPPLSATHVIVSDCRWLASGPVPERAGHIVYFRPQLRSTGTLRAPASTLVSAVVQGSTAVTTEILDAIRSWHEPTKVTL